MPDPKTQTKKQKPIALLSVWNKKGLASFARGLVKSGYDIVSSGGTAKFLKKSGVKVTEVSRLTNYPHMLGGRVKTLHPLIHGGILANRSLKDHQKDMQKFGIRPIDIVVCNLYPFNETISKPNCTLSDAVENIDIGGPCMVRAAAKNFKDVAVIVDPADYSLILRELKYNSGKTTVDTRKLLALKAFRLTRLYDTSISHYLSEKFEGEELFPSNVQINLQKIQDLRYGENPHQKAAFYRETVVPFKGAIVDAEQLHGKELSFNNIVDIDSAWNIVNYFADTTVAVIKHNNPCGAAKGKTPSDAFKKAFACDTVSAFGSIIACNKEIDMEMVEAIGKLFVEAIIAPSYSKEALDKLKEKKNLRIMKSSLMGSRYNVLDYKRVMGGLLIQDMDTAQLGINDTKTVTKREPSLHQMDDLFFAWGIAKHVKSNTIVFVKNGATVGIGAGQMSRIDATEIAGKKAGEKTKGAVMASDAFFPFRDNVDLAAKLGISAIIQPGGSVRDQESIDAANEHGIAMIFTGCRHFRH
ncbi:bifunctional phosphoribosylaminoimidazolecarboxamide formyltransferase/IMP cyclohydrolase [candidate division WOR-1 bacterium RIFOXYA2_FULL_36_21]|uniref:Bifunctional purine biosynthesis protein PurH n=1 Tax=candidate division WOR-1 bacterium RIFOXYB2_FULL_36_35 TaxID=1802578 RepID=A0A1F4S107_UNCSA|nr:MAG: bifunctional phosphoribosylaminoimidazolecarboxamide formyltransferase/IMP cyclohydrolase [candidate division WOR-1 bacterium RIFOXYA2_FULL_36_21]OGC14069.1 MAG: bifunctional phosphoribosylaminoimidazolecarboxamide formyltransferase/IMP cyclohydrolase [candidate division WOR-1 bacterium RIFOXYB2_FULL_36_35]OGC16763.1 MAG: bifunctional phosphoribosylaminoimidazolecarboxamide formyltransferase/IMP cyclohydrolase [candidate division WOR-1 bacterium RIFOXYA12_FULL_36_13]